MTRKPILAVAFAFAICGRAPGQGVITTFAGADWVFPGDGKPAISAPIGAPYGIALDADGNTLFIDTFNCIAGRINKDGTLTVIAGNGFCQDTGDGGPALSAAVNSPVGITTDAQGNIYLVARYRIRKVSPQGIITTIAGNGNPGFSGDGGPAVKASIDAFRGIAVDAGGAVYFTESTNRRVRKVTPDGIISTVAGNGITGTGGDGRPATSANLDSPLGLAIDKSGNLYISESGRIRKVTTAGIISTAVPGVYGGQVALDSGGAIYIGAAAAIFRVAPGTVALIPIAGSIGRYGYNGDGGPALNADFSNTLSMAPDGLGNVVIGDGDNFRIRRLTPDGKVNLIAGNGTPRFPGEKAPLATSPVTISYGGMAIDRNGGVYFSEDGTNRVRKAAAGVINTVAGTGVSGFSGDGGPATQAKLSQPRSLALDAAGNLYIADSYNSVVRKVALNGTISTYVSLPGQVGGLTFDPAGNLYAAVEANSTVYRIDTRGGATVFAGTGVAGLSGDGGPANLAKLDDPVGLAADGAGNLYIADSNNSRIRKVTPQGVISTLVTNSLGRPRDLALDAAGNLYIADPATGSVYKLTTGGVFSRFAGGGSLNSLGDGKTATQVSLTPYAVACDAAGNVYITSGNRIRVVLTVPPTVFLPLSTVSLSSDSGGAPATQPVSILGSVAGLDFNVSVQTANGGNWLTVSATSAATPDLLSVTADPLKLAKGTYTGTVTIKPLAATPATLAVNVTFTVGAAKPPQLIVDQPNLSFAFPKGASAHATMLRIANAGGGALNFTVSSSTRTGGAWLTATPASGSLTPGNPVTLMVTADPARLSPGTYTGALSIQTVGGGNATVPVNMTVSSLSQGLLLTQTGISFTAVAQAGVVPPQSFGVVNTGVGRLNWTASTSTLTGGNWLTVTPSSGTSDPVLAAPQVQVSINANGLDAGSYYGLVHIVAPGAANTPQVVSVFLSVLAVGSDPGASVQPPQLFIPSTYGSGDPGSRELLVYNIGATPKTFYTGASGPFRLQLLPQVATLDPNQPTRVVVQPSGDFPPGEYTDSLNFQFSDARMQAVKITLISMAPPTGSTAHSRAQAADGTPDCVPTTLMPAITSLGPFFAVSAGWPVALSADVRDNCGNPHTSGMVTVSFSNGDPPLMLNSLNDGTWQATWPTRSDSLQQVALTITAVSDRLAISGSREVDGALSSPKDPPSFRQNQIVSAASPASFVALAPGSVITVYGDRLAENADAAQAIPLPTTLGNTRVIMGDRQVPLFYASEGQINALVPYGLNPNTTHQLLIQRGTTYSRPVPIDVADAQPGVFLSNGNALAFAYRGSSPGFLVTPLSPARAGDVLVLYCAGLGVTSQAVDDGSASPPAPTQAPVSVSIGGHDAPVVYSGLVAGLVGLYQINATMPAGVTPGDAVPVSLTVSGQSSPGVNLAVQ